MTSPVTRSGDIRKSQAKEKPLWTLKKESDSPITMAAIIALTSVLTLSTATTMHNLWEDLATAATTLKSVESSIEIGSACELFQCYTTRTWADLQDFQLIKKKLMKRGAQFQDNADNSGKKITRHAAAFIRDDMKILTHGYSPLVNNILIDAHNLGRRFSVLVTESRPGILTMKSAEALLKLGIPVTIIPDSSVALIMGEIDMVLVGAASVVETGGILNQIGTYQISIVAAAFDKPVYCAAQSFKFTRIYPLGQNEIPNNTKPLHPSDLDGNFKELTTKYSDFDYRSPLFDYTPPNYLTLLFTDLGILTPAAVSDELIKLYGK